MRRFSVLLCCLSAFLLPARACLWDKDTLAAEAKGLPGVIQVITGRFERNPALFYEMRLARVSRAIATKPARLELYDDAAVASDRLLKSKDAIAWMAKKRAQLDRIGFTSASKKHWYRYHANLGTFLAHDWLRSGANRQNIAQMKRARDQIKRAIQINPNAHFGREKYQLMAMEWILDPPPKNTFVLDAGILQPDWSSVREDAFHSRLKSMKMSDAVQGLSGLIVLGDAWNSVDIFVALWQALVWDSRTSVAYLASFRLDEIIDAGGRSLWPHATTDTLKLLKEPRYMGGLTPQPLEAGVKHDEYKKQLRAFYGMLRDEAEDYQKRRIDFMEARLKYGSHPDTDKNFWNGWKDTPPPAPEMMQSVEFQKPWFKPVVIFLGTAFCFCLGLFVGQKRLRTNRPFAA